MQMLMMITMPNEPFNSLMRNGSAGNIIGKILEATKPEAAYFTDHDGCRGATLVVHLKDESDVPALCEPWYLNFNASVDFRVAMVAEDLQRANLDEVAKQWS